ncbi:MAG: M48 family metalloprotease [Bacteroidaceae bacterium]|nr:M48 family metalloprotease [Bacteroidaceae bacterium]
MIRTHFAKKLSALLILFLCATISPAQSSLLRILSGLVKAGQAITLTDEQLSEAVKESVAAMDKKNMVCGANNAYTQRLKRLTKGMNSADGIKLNFKVYKTSEVNAFACPDGSVRVYSALMDALSDEELLGVLGHEIGHVALRHSKKSWQDALLRSAASDALGGFSDTWAEFSSSSWSSLGESMISAKHSRHHERQADDYGYSFLKKCGRNPWAMGKAFKKLKALSEKKGTTKYAKLLYAFSSHPDFDERIRRMREQAEADGYTCN